MGFDSRQIDYDTLMGSQQNVDDFRSDSDSDQQVNSKPCFEIWMKSGYVKNKT